MEDVPQIFRDTFNLYKKHQEKTDWPNLPDEFQKIMAKHNGSILCAEILTAVVRYLERRENESKEDRK